MNVIINPGYVDGTITAPASKSMTQRAFAAALLHKGKTIIRGAGNSADELAALNVIQQLGASVMTQTGDEIVITSSGVKPNSATINCGESGLAARLFTPIAALSGNEITITGTGSLLKRPMEGFMEAFDNIGIELLNFNGYLPVTVSGSLRSNTVHVDGSAGSQLLSGLLFALSASANKQTTIEVANLKSKPYIDLTLNMLAQFGKPITHDDYRKFYIDPASFQNHDTVEVNIEGDWSGAACFLVAGAIAGHTTVQNLSSVSQQADRRILDVLDAVGAEVSVRMNAVSVKKFRRRSFDFDATHCPDLFPALAVLAACCKGESHIKGVHRLFYKESNRVESIAQMLEDFGVFYSVENDTFYISGEDTLRGTIIESYNDHRIVMAAAVGAMRAKSIVEITDATAVNKSYPAFFTDLQACGATIEWKENEMKS